MPLWMAGTSRKSEGASTGVARSRPPSIPAPSIASIPRRDHISTIFARVYADEMRLAAPLVFCLWSAVAQQSNVDEIWRKAVAAHQRRDFAEAIKDYRLVLDQRPDLTEARINLAGVLTETGRVDEAIAVLQPASGKANVRRNLALAYYRRGDLPAAIRE